ncbi:MAG: methyltransferase [Bacteroidaceae bacterium]|nr:methyltransferase [Bacteroidaceae bacterium]
MKVGTDGVLVGAWAQLPQSGRLLDIGTGSGLIALMAAQREPGLQVTGIDIHADSVSQAQENVRNSPFAERIKIIQADIRTFEAKPFDSIISNPPFFEEDLLPPDAARCSARHTVGLPFAELIRHASRLLASGGSFNVIIPTSALETFNMLCLENGLRIHDSLFVQTTPKKSPKRILLSFIKSEEKKLYMPENKTLILQDGGERTKAYADLMRDFYL